MERYHLAKDRISEICIEKTAQPDFEDFFKKTAAFLTKTAAILEREKEELTEEELAQENRELYEELFPENYGICYGNPSYAAVKLGEYGKAFCFLYAELRGTIAYAYEKKWWDYTIAAELFLEIYAAFEDSELPAVKTVEDILRSYVNDYCQDLMEQRIAEAVDPQLDFAVRIIMDSDLSDLKYLYAYGEYVSANERGVAEFLNSLSQEQIDSMAETYTEGYRIGFINGRKDITRKKTVNIRYNLGFERMVRSAILKFRAMGLEPVIYRHATHVVNKRGNARIGFTRHFSSTVILYSGNCAPCRMLTRIIRNWQQYTAVRHALRLLERNRLHRRPRLRRGHFPRHSRSSRWNLTMNPDRSSTAISREMREASRSLLIRFLRSERSSRRSSARS